MGISDYKQTRLRLRFFYIIGELVIEVVFIL